MLQYLRWLGLATYLTIFLVLPFSILWGLLGLIFGALLWVGTLVWMGWQAPARISKRLGGTLLTKADCPHLHSVLTEYARRLELPHPTVLVMKDSSLHIGGFGYTRSKTYLVYTRGLLDTLSRESLAAVTARVLVPLSLGSGFCQTWLSQCLSLLDSISGGREFERSIGYFSFNRLLKQILIYPLYLIPTLLLRLPEKDSFDEASTRLSRDRRALSEGLRRMYAAYERTPLNVPANTKHLFLLPPEAREPLGRLFFSMEEMEQRIRRLEA